MNFAEGLHVRKPLTLKQRKNQQALIIYAVFIGVLILTFIATHCLRSFCSKHKQRLQRFISWLRLFRSTGWKWVGEPSVGHAILAGVFAAGNIALTFAFLPDYVLKYFASRLGWLAAINMVVCVFFSMKNTPLSLIVNTSHAELNIIHRTAGCTAGFQVFVHAILYTAHCGTHNEWKELLHESNLEGIGAGVAILILLSAVFRHRNYTLFYFTHIGGFVATVVLTALHRPKWSHRLRYVILCMAAVWVADRALRTATTARHWVNNEVALFPLPNGATRMMFKKPADKTIISGTHCYVWIPQIRVFQVFPFTVVSSGPSGLEFIAKSHQGFTKDAYELASKSPGICMSGVSIDGPYGAVPDTSTYDKLVFIAGGSGAAFTFGVLNEIMNKSLRMSPQPIDFAWAVKSSESLLWFRAHLCNLTSVGSGVKVKLYVTGETQKPRLEKDMEDKLVSGQYQLDLKSVGPDTEFTTQVEAVQPSDGNNLSFLGEAEYLGRVEWTKMDVENIVRDAAGAVDGYRRIFVATCGPGTLTRAVKTAVDNIRKLEGLEIDVHSEEFGSY